MRPYINYTDDEVVTAITETYAARVARSRLVGSQSSSLVKADVSNTARPSAPCLPKICACSNTRPASGLDIAGDGGAIEVEFR